MAQSIVRVAFVVVLLVGLSGQGAVWGASSHDSRWQDLSVEQQAILAPLQNEWPSLPANRKQKWLGIAKRYPKMSSEEQRRLQQNMLLWAALAPQQRVKARENFKKTKHLDPEKKLEKWQDYQQLPSEKKAELRAVPPKGSQPSKPN